jgi:phosphonate transport system ATP-binding protein
MGNAIAVNSGAWLNVVGLRKSFGTSQIILDGIDFGAGRGEFVAVVGPSGSGKTTLFRCIAGLTKPDNGSIYLGNTDVLSLRGRERRQISFVFQQFNLVRRLTALENVLAGRLSYVPTWRGWLRQFPRTDVLLALQLLEKVGLLNQAEQRADTLSGGQQQRVAIARALAQDPTLIIADEPIASLDPQASMDVLALLQTICREKNVAVVCSLHQISLAQTYADRILSISQGRIIALSS